MAPYLLFLLMLMVMLMRVYVPIGQRRSGKQVNAVRLRLIERFLLQRVNLYSIGVVLLLIALTDGMALGGQILVLLSAQLILFIPVRCVLTSDGVGLNNVVFRPWSDFAGFSVGPRRIVLAGREGTQPLNLPLLADNQKEVIRTVRRYLPEIKTGKEAGEGKRAAAS
jgi:hypothetical protein